MRSAILPEDVKISLKVMMSKQKTKVLFAEIDTKSAEVILSFLMLPLGEIVRILKNRYKVETPVVGSLNTLYRGLSNLESNNFWTNGGKKMLLHPRNSFTNSPIKHFKCGDVKCRKRSSPNVSMYYDSGRCDCGKPLNQAMGEIEPKSQAGGDGILVEGLHFLVTDDLKLAPYEPGSMVQTLINLGIVVTEGGEQLNPTLGYNEIVDLLKGSLLSKTPLTDTILRVGKKNTDYVLKGLLDNVEEPSSTNSRKMTVTAMIQKSSNKLLFVKAREDFVDFILSFLAISLGGVESLLRGKTCVESIDNLYKSTSKFINGKHFITRGAKKRLLEPELPPYYVSKNRILTLYEQTSPPIYYYESIARKGYWMRYKDPKGDEGCYVKQPGMFVIYNDLTVIPLRASSINTILNKMKVPLSDVGETEVQIGLKEVKELLFLEYGVDYVMCDFVGAMQGLSILKATLASTTALADGLIKAISNASAASSSGLRDDLDTQPLSQWLKS